MKQLCILLTVIAWTVISRRVLGYAIQGPKDSGILLKVDGNNIELNNTGDSWLQMVLVFSRGLYNSLSIRNTVTSTLTVPCSIETNTSNVQRLIEPSTLVDTSKTMAMTATTAAKFQQTPKPTSLECRTKFIRLADKCYYFSSTTANWHNALKECESLGAHLAYPMNSVENAELVSYIRRNSINTEGWIIGGTDEDTEGRWVWSHSKSPIIFHNWSWRQPDNSRNEEDCLHYIKRFDWKWNDGPCNTILPFICQQ